MVKYFLFCGQFFQLSWLYVLEVVAKNVQGGSPDISAEVGGIYGLNEKSNIRWKYAVNESALAGVYEYTFRQGVKGSFGLGYNVVTLFCSLDKICPFCFLSLPKPCQVSTGNVKSKFKYL